MEDADAIGALGAVLGYAAPDNSTRHRLADVLASDRHAVFVAMAPEGIVGWVHVFAAPRVASEPFAELGGLAVDEQARRRGIGRALVGQAEAWAVERGYGKARVRVSTEREGAHAFYESLAYDRAKSQYIYDRRLPEPDGPPQQAA
jgi:GNAT superfamily N-acetyltransferase